MVTNNVIGIDIKRRLQDITDIKEDSDASVKRSLLAIRDAVESLHRSDITQKQLEQALVNGDQVVEVQTLRVDPVTGQIYVTAAERFEANQRMNAIRMDDLAVNVKNFGAKGDGITDDTDAIQSAVDYLKTLGGGTLKIPPGTYLIDATKFVDGRFGIRLIDNITVDMYGAVLKVIPNNKTEYGVFDITKNRNVRIFGGYIIGDKFEHFGTTGEWGHGILIKDEESSNILIKDMHIKDLWGDGVYIKFGFGDNIVIDNVVIEDCRRHELGIVGGKNIRVLNSTLTKSSGIKDGVINATYGGRNIDVEPHEAGYSDGIELRDCSFTNPAELAVDFHGDYKHYNAKVIDCDFDTPLDALKINNGHGAHVEGNKIRGAKESILLANMDDSFVLDNTIEDCERGIYLRDSSNPTIKGNTLDGIIHEGIRVFSQFNLEKQIKNIEILDNEVKNSGSASVGAIRVDGTSGKNAFKVSILDNQIKDSPGRGIYVNYADHLEIKGNQPENFNTLDLIGGNAISVLNSKNYNVDDNDFLVIEQPTQQRAMIQFVNCALGKISENTFRKASGVSVPYAIELNNSPDTVIRDNDFTGSSDISEITGTVSNENVINNRMNNGKLMSKDYESGIFSPSVNSGTYSLREGYYIRDKKIVTVTARMHLSVGDSSLDSHLIVNNMPFVPKNITASAFCSISNTDSDYEYKVEMNPDNVTAYIYRKRFGGGTIGSWGAMPRSALRNGSRIEFTLIYYI